MTIKDSIIVVFSIVNILAVFFPCSTLPNYAVSFTNPTLFTRLFSIHGDTYHDSSIHHKTKIKLVSSLSSSSIRWTPRKKISLIILSAAALPRYGPLTNSTSPNINPNDDFFANQEEWEKQNVQRVVKQEEDFRLLFKQILDMIKQQQQQQEEEEEENPKKDMNILLPSLLTRNINLLLNMRGYEGTTLMKKILQQAQEEEENQKDAVAQAMEYILSFMEEFVDQTYSLDEQNKRLLGKIIRAIRTAQQQKEKDKDDEKEDDDDDDEDDSTTTTLLSFQQENNIDLILKQEKDYFTPGFLRHLEGECRRIESAPFVNPQSISMVQLLRTIQLRILEELGQEDLGDTALVLGQLMGYESSQERLAILDTGLKIRGLDFAYELQQYTQQALQDFQTLLLQDKVDDELITIISEIDDRIQWFILQANKTITSAISNNKEENFQ